MPISCGRVVIDGYIYTINLEFRDELGNVQTDMQGPIDETEEQPKELIKKINDIVAKLKESLQTSPNPKPLSSYKCIQINNAGIKLDESELAWSSNNSLHTIQDHWFQAVRTLGALRAQLQVHHLPPSVASTATTIDFTVGDDSDAPTSAATPARDVLGQFIEGFSLNDLGSNATEKINAIWVKVGEGLRNDRSSATKAQVEAFLCIVNKLAAQEGADKSALRDAVRDKLREVHQPDASSQTGAFNALTNAFSSFLRSSSTAQKDNWNPTAANLAVLARELQNQHKLENLYDTSNSYPTAEQIMPAPTTRS